MTSRVRILVLSLAMACCPFVAPDAASADPSCCKPCCAAPPVETTVCLTDPYTGCTFHVNLCVPSSFGDEQPCVTWRRGVFRRRIATLCWKCCGHTVEVVITRRGRIIVRG